jgi:hypothetical protein
MTFLRKLTLLLVLFASASSWADNTEELKKQIAPYMEHVAQPPDWLYSRLQMYWTTHATDVFCQGESFDHPGGQRAPEPTVKFNGTRSHQSFFNRPSIENLVPYDDDSLGRVTFINPATGKMEKVAVNKTGCNVASLNVMILDIARKAALVYKATGERRYADLALPVVRTFLLGIYYRNVPTDLLHGHMQTLYGMTTFEVIHEDAIAKLYEAYPILRPLLPANDQQRCDDALRKWAENIIANGVPHNNWDLFQAEFIAKVALMLQPNNAYSDGRGREHYLDVAVNQTSVRQWSMEKLAQFGFDKEKAIWYEAPGYSITVLNDFSDFANLLDREAGIDLYQKLPILLRAIKASAQYLTPARMFVGYGDSHPTYLSTKAIDNVLDYAQRHGKKELYNEFTALRQAILPTASAATIGRYISPLFYSQRASWLIQRSGMEPQHDLCVSLCASYGNHQHANGLSAEFYGKGYMLGPDAGIGKYLYSGADYNEYYSRMPAHNTVVVDGVSDYPVMWSEHPFTVVDTCATAGRSHSVLAFEEPETGSEQQRTNAIVKTSEKGGYYVDIFRSHRRDGMDKTHDYFYHNLGQHIQLSTADGKPLDMQPTNELAFAGGHLYAYSYIYDKKVAPMNSDVKVQFSIDQPSTTMTLWMRHEPQRKVFQALSPVNMQYDRMPNQPYKIGEQPTLTFVARQEGEAWLHPFVCILEPSSAKEPSEIEQVSYFTPKSTEPTAVGIVVKLKSGRTDYIFSSARPCTMTYKGMKATGYFQVITKD